MRLRASSAGCRGLVVCDNLKAGVTAACRYEPGINRTYQDLATHYGTTILPTRLRKPRDKAKVEVAVLIVERWILARLRDRRFFSLAELNVAIARTARCAQCPPDAQARRQPPAVVRDHRRAGADAAAQPNPIEYAEWRRARVAPDYHVEVHGHFYSVPSSR